MRMIRVLLLTTLAVSALLLLLLLLLSPSAVSIEMEEEEEDGTKNPKRPYIRSAFTNDDDNNTLIINEQQRQRLLTLDYYENLSQLERKWYMSKPEFSYYGYEIQLNYNISEAIDVNDLDLRLYDGVECRRGSNEIDGGNFLFPTLEVLDPYSVQVSENINIFNNDNNNSSNTNATTTTALAAAEFQHIEVKVRIDTARIRETNLYHAFGDFAQINFCVKVAVFHEEERLDEPIEVNWRETPVLLSLRSGSFDVEEEWTFGIGDGNTGTNTNGQTRSSPFDNAYSVYEKRNVEIEICDNDDSNVINNNNNNNNKQKDGSSSSKGGDPVGDGGHLLELCIQVGNETLMDGGSLMYVDEFAYIDTIHHHKQQAIVHGTGGQAAQASQPLRCDDTATNGKTICRFYSYLSPEFFTYGGIIDGYGTALLQFGEITNSVEGNYELSVNACCRIVPVRFGLQMTALPADNEKYDQSGGVSTSTMYFMVTLLSSVLCSFFLC